MTPYILATLLVAAILATWHYGATHGKHRKQGKHRTNRNR